MSDFQREERYIVVKLKTLNEDRLADLRFCLNRNNISTVECVVLESDKPYYEAGWKLVEEHIQNNRTTYEDVENFIQLGPQLPKLDLYKTTCELRDDRWSFHIDSSDEPCSIRVTHRKFGDYYDWPEDVFDDKVPAALRAYDIEEELSFYTRSTALTAAKSFLRRWGAGDVEYLEYDRNSRSMIVVNHQTRRDVWGSLSKHVEDTTDPLQPYFGATDER